VSQTLLPSQAIDQTLARFPSVAASGFEILPLEKGGSDRKFYRILPSGGTPLILVKYGSHREENRHYVDIARFLAGCGVSVPAIYFHDESEGLIWMQDLGENDLWSFRADPWSSREPLYRLALGEAFRLHHHATPHIEGSGLTLQMEFDEQLYLWEQNYFFEHCLAGVFGMGEHAVRRYRDLPAFSAMASRLASLPRVMVHRDFQSQNILIHADRAWLIDFQGMRPGLVQYDLASLLYDPYVELADTERGSLLAHYKNLMRSAGCPPDDDFDEILHLCAAQRLMQALGAYGFLGLQRGRPDFLRHVAPARRSLREVASRIDGLDEFLHLLDDPA